MENAWESEESSVTRREEVNIFGWKNDGDACTREKKENAICSTLTFLAVRQNAVRQNEILRRLF